MTPSRETTKPEPCAAVVLAARTEDGEDRDDARRPPGVDRRRIERTAEQRADARRRRRRRQAPSPEDDGAPLAVQPARRPGDEQHGSRAQERGAERDQRQARADASCLTVAHAWPVVSIALLVRLFRSVICNVRAVDVSDGDSFTRRESGSGTGSSAVRRLRQPQREHRPAGLRLHLQRAAHRLRQLPRDREPQPAAGGELPVDAVEALEDVLHMLGRDSRPLVLDGEQRRPPARILTRVRGGVCTSAFSTSTRPIWSTRCSSPRTRGPPSARPRAAAPPRVPPARTPRRPSPPPARARPARARRAAGPRPRGRGRAARSRASRAGRPARAWSRGTRAASPRPAPRRSAARGSRRARRAASAARATRSR